MTDTLPVGLAIACNVADPTHTFMPDNSTPVRHVAALVAAKAERNGARTFLRFESESFSYAEVHERSNRIANALATMGVARGTHVAMLMDNKPEVVLTYFALAKLGAIAIPVNTAAKGDMLRYFLTQSDSRFVVFDRDYGERLCSVIATAPSLQGAVVVGDPAPAMWGSTRPLVRFDTLFEGPATAPEIDLRGCDPALIMYTSGTTGRSKGVVVPQASVMAQAKAIADAGGYTADDVLYTCLPLFHANAWWCSCLPAMLADASVAIARRFSATEFWNDVRRHGATQFNLLGAMATFLWNRPPLPTDCDHSVNQAFVVPVPEAFYQAFETRFGIRLKSLYGLTDGCITATKRDGDPPDKWKSAGRACTYVKIRIVDDDDDALPPGTVGEIVLRGREPWVLGQGYYNMPDATVTAWRNLWLHTGDRGFLDEDGYLYFVDRKKDAIRRRGENVSSYEVEQIVLGHPGVAEVAAFGVKSQHGEEEVMIAVVRREGNAVDEADLVTYCNANMPYYMVPRFVSFVDELPRNTSEKIEKYKLRADAESRLTEIWDRERVADVNYSGRRPR